MFETTERALMAEVDRILDALEKIPLVEGLIGRWLYLRLLHNTGIVSSRDIGAGELGASIRISSCPVPME
jgi:hypothetical protein